MPGSIQWWIPFPCIVGLGNQPKKNSEDWFLPHTLMRPHDQGKVSHRLGPGIWCTACRCSTSGLKKSEATLTIEPSGGKLDEPPLCLETKTHRIKAGGWTLLFKHISFSFFFFFYFDSSIQTLKKHLEWSISNP